MSGNEVKRGNSTGTGLLAASKAIVRNGSVGKQPSYAGLKADLGPFLEGPKQKGQKPPTTDQKLTNLIHSLGKHIQRSTSPRRSSSLYAARPHKDHTEAPKNNFSQPRTRTTLARRHTTTGESRRLPAAHKSLLKKLDLKGLDTKVTTGKERALYKSTKPASAAIARWAPSKLTKPIKKGKFSAEVEQPKGKIKWRAQRSRPAIKEHNHSTKGGRLTAAAGHMRSKSRPATQSRRGFTRASTSVARNASHGTHLTRGANRSGVIFLSTRTGTQLQKTGTTNLSSSANASFATTHASLLATNSATPMPTRANQTQMSSTVLSSTHIQLQSNPNARANSPIPNSHINTISGQRSNSSTIIIGHHRLPRESIEKILDPQIQDGDGLFSLLDTADRMVGALLIAKIVAQLQRGPKSLAKHDLLQEVNAVLPEGYEPIDKETWKALLQETLLITIRQIKPFGDTGLRKPDDIYADAGMILKLADTSLPARRKFTAWESHFGIHCIADNLMDPDVALLSKPMKLHPDFVNAIKLQLIERASKVFEGKDFGDALRHSFETRIQWAVARLSAIANSDHKINAATAFIKDLAHRNRIAVGRMLILIVRHSTLCKYFKPKKYPLVPQWQSDELRTLLRRVIKDIPSLVHDNTFRGRLTEKEQKALNSLIYKANYGDIMERLSRMGSDRPVEDYIDAITEADESGRVLQDIILNMLDHHEKQNMS